MKLAITSIAEGEAWKKVAAVSFHSFEQYARRIGADFAPLEGRKIPEQHFHWEKLFMAGLFSKYDRVMWIDADAIIKTSAPSIFEAVPEDSFGAFDEGYLCDREEEFKAGASFYGVHLDWPERRPFRYFNAGVMVISRQHAEVFRIPEKFYSGSMMPEQTFTNTMVYKLGLKFKDFGSTWNGFHFMHQRFEDREKLNIIHYPGWPKDIGWEESMLYEMKKDYR